MSIDTPRTRRTPTSLPRLTSPRGASALLAVLLTCLVGLLGFAGAAPAQAHDQLVDSSPAPNAALDAPPTDITLTYSANIMEIGPMVVVQDAAGTTWATTEPVIDGMTVTSTIEDALPEGTYAINWRVVSSDGHPITGTIPFTVGDPTADATAEPAAPPTGTPTATPPASTSPSGATTEPTAEIASQSAFDVPRMLLIGGLGAVVALGVAWVVARSRKGSQHEPDAAEPPTDGSSDAR